MHRYFRKRIKTLSLLLSTLVIMPAFSSAATVSVQSPETVNAVLELYTSEGCSSCPPADRWLSSIKPLIGKELAVVPLAFHVDYWNYLGWQDAYSNPAFTERQRALGQMNRQRTIYTPEFFVDNREKRGNKNILSAVKQNNREKSDWNLKLDVGLADPENLVVTVAIENISDQQPDSTELFIALFENNIQREIKRGENTGKRLQHDFVVREWIGPVVITASKLTHQQEIKLPADAKGINTGLATVLKDKHTGRNLQALAVNLGDLFTPGD
ncbi:MAG: DUF1223 domain-containing protein [Gammaproteobacteria bacterium]|nr:DUF1223 domain-containing protein [Gammaproteobacteria bacterium]